MRTIHTTVFSDGRKGGNPCPVIFDYGELTTEEMLKITKDFGFESVFISESSEKNIEYKFRYFVPNHEMEMCVHATIAGSTFLVKNNFIKKDSIDIETILGVIKIKWKKMSDKKILITVNQFSPQFLQINPNKKEVAKCLGIDEDIIDTTNFPIQSVSTSRPKLMVPIINDKYLHNLEPNFKTLWSTCDRYNTTGFYPFSLQTENKKYDFEARQFPNNVGYNEDPATGVAACALGAYLTKYSKKKNYNNKPIIIGQGKTLGKKSKIMVKTSINKDLITTEVSGYAEIMAEKTLPNYNDE